MGEETPSRALSAGPADRWPPNPFSPGSALEPEWFTGRRETLDQLRKAVRDRWPLVAVQGPRGIGKTSLVRRFLAEPELRGIYLDVRDHVEARDIGRPDPALQAIIRGLVEEISYDHRLPAHIDPAKATDQVLWREVFPGLCTAEAPRLVLAVDELDLLDPDARRRFIRFARRKPKTDLPQPPLWILVLGEAWGEALDSSVALGGIPSLRLDLLEQQETFELLKQFPDRGLFSLDPGARVSVFEETAGHPLFLSALLDALYDLRWSANDRSPVTRDEVWRAVARVESRPSERIQHAVRQAGPAAQKVLRTLAEDGREALSAHDLIELFRREWPGWEQEVAATLEGLRHSGLLREEAGIWSHRIPMLAGYVVNIDRAEIAAGHRPPRADAWVAFRVGEDFEREGRRLDALEQYRDAASLDPEFWLPRWHAARLLLERPEGAQDPAQRSQDLRKARELLARLLLEVASQSAAHRAIHEALGKALVELSATLAPAGPERIKLLDELQRLDRRLKPEAADLVAQTEASRFEPKLKREAPAAWGRRTRAFLREYPYVGASRLRRELAAWLARRIDEPASNAEEQERLRDLVRRVVPAVLEDAASEAEVLPLWAALANWARRAKEFAPPVDEAWLDPQAWGTLLLEAPPAIRDKLLERLGGWLDSDYRRAFERGREGEEEAEHLTKIVLSSEIAQNLGGAAHRRDAHRRLVRRMWDSASDLILTAAEDPERRQRILGPAGRCLASFRGSPWIEEGEFDYVLGEFNAAWRGTGATPSASVSEVAEEKWNDLLSDEQRAFFPTLVPVPTKEAEGPLEDEKARVESWLDGAYEIEGWAPMSVPGFSRDQLKDILKGYLARETSRGHRRVLIRSFGLRSPNPETDHLMRAIWDRERRAAAALSTTQAGRALLQFLDARHVEESNVALLVTEWFGTDTLQDLLRDDGERTLRERLGRDGFWRRFTPLLEAVEGLHRSGFLHRTLSPSAIYVAAGESGDGASPEPIEGAEWRLSHFEWSVYLRGVRSRGRYRARALDRYTAPEALRAALGVPDRLRGETFASDLYALGLVLFECLVRPFRGEADLGSYASADAYDAKEQGDHRAWLGRLQSEVRAARHSDLIESHEEELLLPLLEFDAPSRTGTLEKTLSALRRVALLESVRCEEPLPVFTTLTKRKGFEGDPRDDLRCIAWFLRRELPEIEIAETAELTPDYLASVIKGDLRGGTVLLNRNLDNPPLIVQSRSGALYRLEPFRWDLSGSEGHAHSEEYRDLAYLTLARPVEGDEAAGEPLGVLLAGVAAHDIEERGVRSILQNRKPTDPGWRELFDRAAEARSRVQVENEQRLERERLLDVLRVSTEVEYELAWREAAFVRVAPDTCLVRSSDPSVNLAVIVSGWLSYDLLIEVAGRRDAAGTGTEVSLDERALDMDSGVVDLSEGINAGSLPAEGMLRPAANRGAASLYRRRRLVLQELRHDALLFNAVIRPAESTTELPARRLEFVLPELDEDKQEIVRRSSVVRPLLLVQGPPGTGKTTLATEVVLQKLKQTPNARILLTSQAHNPLDNLLERLLQEKDRNEKAKELLDQVEIVRVPSGSRPDDEYPDRSRQLFPYELADELFRRLRRRSEENQRAPGIHGEIARALTARLAPYATAPRSLLKRVEDSANLVFVTTNARDIEAASPLSFDLVIVEEAARCAPMELLGAMRLSRQWLLIGDHHQLPPFGFEQVFDRVRQRFDNEITERRARSQNPDSMPGAAKAEQDALRRVERTLEAMPGYMQLFRHIHEEAPPSGLYATVLETQWRMHPALGTMVSEVFYDEKSVKNPAGDELAALTKRRTHPFREPRYLRDRQIVWIDFDPFNEDAACGEYRGRGGELENEAERRTAVAFLRQLDTTRRAPDVAVLTPYRRQAEQFRALMRRGRNEFHAFGEIEQRIFTVDSFQGRQAGTIVLSLVRNNDASPAEVRRGIGFLADKRRGTVMFSRAERLLIVLGCSAHFKRFPETGWLMDIHRRAHRVHWRELLPADERAKIEQRRTPHKR